MKKVAPVQSTSPPETPAVITDDDGNLEPSRFASETVESEQESLNAYKQATANAKIAPQIIIEAAGSSGQSDADSSKTEEERCKNRIEAYR